MLGGSDDLLQLIQQDKLSDLLQNAQGKPALPQELQAAVDAARKAKGISSTTAAFVPSGMTSAQYTQLQQLAADMQSTDSRLQRCATASLSMHELACYLDNCRATVVQEVGLTLFVVVSCFIVECFKTNAQQPSPTCILHQFNNKTLCSGLGQTAHPGFSQQPAV